LLPVLGAPAQTILLSSFRGREQHRSYAWFNATSVVLSMFCVVLVLLAGGNVVLAAVVAGSVSIGTSLVGWKLSRVRPLLPNPRAVPWRQLRQFIAGGLPFLSWQITLLAYGQVDRLLLGIFVPTSEVGWYAAAYQIVGIVVFVPTLVIAPLFPALSRTVHDAAALRKTIAQTLRILMIIMGLLGVGSIIAAPGVPRLFGWPADFSNAVPLMMILALHLPIVALDMVFGAVLMAIHRESRLVAVGLVAVLFNLAANLVAIPFFQTSYSNGAIGSSIVTVLTEMLMCVGALILIPKRYLDGSILWQAGRLTVPGVVGALVGLALLAPLMESLHIILALSIASVGGAIVYVVGATVLRAITIDDVGPLTALVRRGKP